MAKSRRKARRASTPSRVRKPRVVKCKHESVFVMSLSGREDSYRLCVKCDAVGVWGLGPANDADLNVQDEILAAGIIAKASDLFGRQPGGPGAVRFTLTNAEEDGYLCDETSPFSGIVAWHVGYLVRCAVDDDEGWPWDVTRPIAEQWPVVSAIVHDQSCDTRTDAAFPCNCGARESDASCSRHNTAARNADGDCIECARECTAEGLAQEDALRTELAKPDAEVAAFDSAHPPCDGCEAPFGCDPGRCYKAPDRFDDEAFDVSDVLPDEVAR